MSDTFWVDTFWVARGRAGELTNATARESVARTLLATPAGHAQLIRLVLEWLGMDAVDSEPKDVGLFPEWASLRADVLAESKAMVDASVFGKDGTLQSLFSTTQTTVSPALAKFYGLPGAGTVALPEVRKGILLTAGFLSSSAHSNSTAPVKRGAVVRKKLLCQELKLPTAPSKPIVVPPPSADQTTRERFSAHSSDPTCASCHNLLDPIGFGLEHFDAIGRYRTQENAKPIDVSGTLTGAGGANGSFRTATELVSLLASAPEVLECFEHQVFRFAAGRSNDAQEQTFLDFVKTRHSGSNLRILDLMVDYVASDSFVMRTP